jgi:hypothetical protein
MENYNDVEQSERVYSHLQIQQKQIDPSNKILEEINRNLQLGNIDGREYEHKKIILDTLLIMKNHPSPLMRKEALFFLQKINTDLVLSGSKDGFVRKEINTHTNINKVTQETKGGALSGIFKKGD